MMIGRRRRRRRRDEGWGLMRRRDDIGSNWLVYKMRGTLDITCLQNQVVRRNIPNIDVCTILHPWFLYSQTQWVWYAWHRSWAYDSIEKTCDIARLWPSNGFSGVFGWFILQAPILYKSPSKNPPIPDMGAVTWRFSMSLWVSLNVNEIQWISLNINDLMILDDWISMNAHEYQWTLSQSTTCSDFFKT